MKHRQRQVRRRAAAQERDGAADLREAIVAAKKAARQTERKAG